MPMGPLWRAPLSLLLKEGQAAPNVVLLDWIASKAKSAAVCLSGLRVPAESSQQVSPRRVEKVVFAQLAAQADLINQGQSLHWAVSHGDGNGAIELHDRGWGERGKLCVEGRDLCPVRFLRTRCLSVESYNRRLQLIWPNIAKSQRCFCQL